MANIVQFDRLFLFAEHLLENAQVGINTRPYSFNCYSMHFMCGFALVEIIHITSIYNN